MTITRETLELAALAGGVEWNATSGHGWVIKRGVYARWCPHLDDGDAARLAVQLRMNIRRGGDWVAALRGQIDVIRSHDGTEPDKLRAWREAVVLCAAAVGERMQLAKRANATPEQLAGSLAAVDEFDAAKRGER